MIRSPGRVSTDVNFWCVSINKTRVSGSLSVLSGLLWCVTMLCIIPHSQDPSDCHYWDSPDYLLGRARNVTPFLWWASHRAQICLASPGCCWLYYASKILMGRTETAGTIFCLTMRIISHCQSRIVGHNIRTYWATHWLAALIFQSPAPIRNSGSWGRESEQTQDCQGVYLSHSDWLLAARERCDWSMMGPWSLVTTRAMNNGPRSSR